MLSFLASAAFHLVFLKDTKNSIQSLKNPKIFFAMAMAMSIYRKLCLLVSPKKSLLQMLAAFGKDFLQNITLTLLVFYTYFH